MKIYIGGVEVLTATQITITDDGAPPPGSGTGTQGPPGATGPAGATGATGPAGAVGATGAQGVQGVPGPAGATGAQGPAGPAGGGTAPPPTNGGTDPPPPSGTDFPTPVLPIVVPWPESGQVMLHVSLGYEQTVCYRLVWKDAMDPNKSGFVKISEQPGSAVMNRTFQLNNNGVPKYGPYVESAPSGNLVNYPTPGNPSSVQMHYDDTLDIIVTNGPRPLGGANGNILIDIGVPERY